MYLVQSSKRGLYVLTVEKFVSVVAHGMKFCMFYVITEVYFS